MNIKELVICITLVLLTNTSEIQDQIDLGLTIYSDFAIVKDLRVIAFDKGDSSLYFDDVATTIQTETVSFRPLNSNTSIRVYQQNYEYNLASKYGILKKYINKEVTIQVVLGQKSQRITGILLSYEPAFILKVNKGISIYDEVKGIHLAELPEGFITLPTLVWKVHSPADVETDCLVAYRATGFSWKADYLLTLNEKQTRVSLAGWVTIDNNSGKNYKEAKLKLIAGDVNTVQKPAPRFLRRSYGALNKNSGGESFQEKSFSDYHMYTLQRPVDLNENSQKQIEFIPTKHNITIRKFNRITVNTGGYDQLNLKADNVIQFVNSNRNKLGIALPKGTIRAFKSDTDGSLQFVGQDKIQHTPRDQKITLTVGKAFDISTNKTIISRTSVDNGHDAQVLVQIRNHKDSEVQIELKVYNTYGGNLDINWASPVQLIKKSANEYLVRTQVGPNQKVEYRWTETYRR